MILVLLEDVFNGLRIWDDWLQPGGQVYAELCHCFLVYLAEAVVKTGPHVLLVGEIFYSEESSKASRLLCPTEARWTFRQKRRAVAVEQSLVLSN